MLHNSALCLSLSLASCSMKTNVVSKLDGRIFDNESNNPYSPGNNGQFELPFQILGTATDDHGRVQEIFLDKIFNYKQFGDATGLEDDGFGGKQFSAELENILINALTIKSIETRIKKYQECSSDYCKKQLQKEEGKKDELSIEDLSSTADIFDQSIALLFGNKTTIGQVR